MDNITIKQYFELDNTYEYDVLLSSLKPINVFNKRTLDISNLTYSEVKNVIKLLPKCNTKEAIESVFNIVFRLDENEFDNSSVINLFSCLKTIKTSFENIIETERKLLSSVEDADSVLWQQAGGDRLNAFSYVMPLIKIGKHFGLYPFELEHKRYDEVLILLASEKVSTEVEREFHKLKAKIK